jgi:flagellar biosynthesis/type III secretory pathway M-ring protein FliF/YscJ
VEITLMDFVRKLWTQTGEHLRGLSRSQRIAIGLCVVIVAGALIMLVRWSASRSYVPLPLAEMNAEELSQAESALVSMGVDYRIENNRVLVPPQQRTLILGRLMESDAISGKLAIDFAKLIESDSPWLSENEKQWRRTVALSSELSKTISSMSGIESARVFIDNTMRRGFAGRSVSPSAVVAVVPSRDFEMNQKRVHMLASLVAGAVAGLDISKVRVVDEAAGRSYTASDPEDAMAADLLDMRRSEERHYEGKIYERLSYIPGVLVSVFAEQETNQTQTQQTRLEKPSISKSSTETTTETRGPASAEPGVRPNVGAAVAAGGMAEQMEKEITDEEFLGERGREVTTRQNTRGVVTRLTASIGVPRSWLVQTYMELKQTTDQPDEQTLQAFEQAEFTKIVDAVKRIINAEEDEQVAVSSFVDTPGTVLAAYGGGAGGVPGPPMRAESGTISFVRSRAMELAVIGLAAFSLLLMLFMVRKASDESDFRKRHGKLTELEDMDMPEAPEVPTVGSYPLGSEGEVLTGHELDKDQLHSVQVAEQVNKMVKDNPAMAASLVERWMNDTNS